VALAPLSGVSDVVFRRIAQRWGASFVVTEMVAAHEYLKGSAEAVLRAAGEGVAPHVVQLVGREPVSMAGAARMAEAAGADIVDINLGCPAKSVTGGLAGSALMRDPDLVLRILEAVVAAASRPVTLKMRLGWDENSLNAAEIGRRVVAAGVSQLTVHGRTRQQFYKGTADWRAIARVVEAVPVPVIANGDIANAADARACLEQSGAAGVMVGRAAVGQPWLVGAIAAELAGRARPLPEPAERAAMAIEHYEGLLSLYGRDMGRRHARKHLAAYADCARADGFVVGEAERRELVTTDSPERASALLAGLYADRERKAA
jgi:nifR3 family TIM-barrel protein